jgi:hypothetical protein
MKTSGRSVTNDSILWPAQATHYRLPKLTTGHSASHVLSGYQANENQKILELLGKTTNDWWRGDGSGRQNRREGRNLLAMSSFQYECLLKVKFSVRRS